MPRTIGFVPLALIAALAVAASAQSTRYVDVGRGDVPVYLPSTYDDGTPMPLIVMLHGYSASGPIQESYFRFRAQQESFGFMLAIPDGTIDNFGNWWIMSGTGRFYGDPDRGSTDQQSLFGIIDPVGNGKAPGTAVSYSGLTDVSLDRVGVGVDGTVKNHRPHVLWVGLCVARTNAAAVGVPDIGQLVVTERRADRHFTATCDAAREEQRRHIRTGNEQEHGGADR